MSLFLPILRTGIQQEEFIRAQRPVGRLGHAIMHDGAVRPRPGNGGERHVHQVA